MPVIDIEPDLTRSDRNKMIIMAHLAIQRNEHYYAAIKPSKSQTTTGPQNTNEKTPEKNTPKGKTGTSLITPHKAAHYVSQKTEISLYKTASQPRRMESNRTEKSKESGKVIYK